MYTAALSNRDQVQAKLGGFFFRTATAYAGFPGAHALSFLERGAQAHAFSLGGGAPAPKF
jgi:hypothetical protein